MYWDLSDLWLRSRAILLVHCAIDNLLLSHFPPDFVVVTLRPPDGVTATAVPKTYGFLHTAAGVVVRLVDFKHFTALLWVVAVVQSITLTTLPQPQNAVDVANKNRSNL